MSLNWDYPLFVLPLEQGLVSVVDQGEDGQRRVSVAVFTDRTKTEYFAEQVGMEAEGREIANDREFAYLLHGLRHPVTSVAFDSAPQGREINARWIVGIEQLLERHLPWAASPWGYPVYVVAEPEGVSCIEGAADARGPLKLVCVFTTSEAARQYMDDARLEGSVQPVSTPDELQALLEGLEANVTAMALDPIADNDQRSAKWCVEIATVLDKYMPGPS
jgi:hypothetical protein